MDVEVLLWPELAARAGSPRRARRLVADGAYRRVLRGAYVDAVHDDGPGVRCAALQRLLPPEVALSGRSALWALGLDLLPRGEVLDVTTQRGRHLERRPGVLPHTALLPDVELVELPGGMLAVSAARAVVDVARREPLVEAVAVGDVALRSGAATRLQIEGALGRSAGLRGVVAARTVVAHLEARSESPGESRLRMRLVLGGLRPEAQVDYYDDRGRHLGRIDLVVDGVLVEYDGREQRLRKEVFTHDRRRQNRLTEAGAELRRFTAADVAASCAAALCAEVRRAVALAAIRGTPRLVRGPDTLREPRLRPLPTLAERPRSAAA